MIRTKFPKLRIKFIRKKCPCGGKIWKDKQGKIHKGLLIRQLRKAKSKGFKKLVYLSPETNDKTIFIFKTKNR